MPPLLRSVLVVIFGFIAGSVAMMSLHFASMLIYPLPVGVDIWDAEAMRAAMATMPVGAWLSATVAHGVGTFVGAWLAALLADRAQMVHALIVGSLFLAAGVFNSISLEVPTWVWPVDLAVYPIAAGLAGLLAGAKR